MGRILFLIAPLCFLFFDNCTPNSGRPDPTQQRRIDSLFTPVRADIAAGDFDAARAKVKLLEHKHRYTSLASSLDSLTAEIDSAQAKRVAALAPMVPGLKKKMRQEVDDMKGITFYYDPATPKYANANAFATYIGQSKDNLWLRFKINYHGDDWLFIRKYMIKVDSTVLEVIPQTEVQRDNDAGGIWETWDETVNADYYAILKQVAESKTAKIRFEGRQYYQEKPITPAQKESIKNVLKLYEAMGGRVPI